MFPNSRLPVFEASHLQVRSDAPPPGFLVAELDDLSGPRERRDYQNSVIGVQEARSELNAVTR